MRSSHYQIPGSRLRILFILIIPSGIYGSKEPLPAVKGTRSVPDTHGIPAERQRCPAKNFP
jgi:hypothetical protein